MRKCTYLNRNAFGDSVLCHLNAIAFHDCEDNIIWNRNTYAFCDPGARPKLHFGWRGRERVEVRIIVVMIQSSINFHFQSNEVTF